MLLTLAASGQVWTPLPDFPGTPRDDAASFSTIAQVYVGTGMDAGFQLTNDWYVYNVGDGWQAIAPLPANGRQYASGFTLTGLGPNGGYLFGGLDANGPLDELWQYNAQLDEWTPLAPLPAPGRYACAVIATTDFAYVCGGLLAGGVPTNEVWRYDRATDSWSPRADLPGPARHRAAAMDLMVIGGADSSYQALSDVYRYDPDADQWEQELDLPAPRYGAKCAGSYLLCGASSTSQFHNDVWTYEVIDWDATLVPPFTGGPRKGGVAAYVWPTSESDAILFGLGTDGNARHNDWWMVEFYTGVEEHHGATTTVFPNPASTELTPVRPADWMSGSFAIHDATGRKVLGGTLQREVPLDVRCLAPGRYGLRMDHEGRTLRAFFIKLP